MHSNSRGSHDISQAYRPPRPVTDIALLFVLYSLCVTCPLLFVYLCVLCFVWASCVILYDMCICVLCLTVVPLSPGKTDNSLTKNNKIIILIRVQFHWLLLTRPISETKDQERLCWRGPRASYRYDILRHTEQESKVEQSTWSEFDPCRRSTGPELITVAQKAGTTVSCGAVRRAGSPVSYLLNNSIITFGLGQQIILEWWIVCIFASNVQTCRYKLEPSHYWSVGLQRGGECDG
jgi:hypothetical protein